MFLYFVYIIAYMFILMSYTFTTKYGIIIYFFWLFYYVIAVAFVYDQDARLCFRRHKILPFPFVHTKSPAWFKKSADNGR